MYKCISNFFRSLFNCNNTISQSKCLDEILVQKMDNPKPDFNQLLVHLDDAPALHDYANIIYWLRKSAKEGYLGAQYMMGVAYYKGIGVKVDYFEAVQWWRSSAYQGHGLSQFNIGVCYLRGTGVPYDFVEALKWFRKSAKFGCEQAPKMLDILENR